MKRIIIFFLLTFFINNTWSQPLTIKLNHTIIIDTDCAIDDMRAISILLSRPEIITKAIVLSDGSLAPGDGIKKVRALLHEFNQDSIPVAAGEVLKGINPPWRQFCKEISWGTSSGQQTTGLNAVSLIYEKLNQSNDKIILVCLGPLTNISKLIKNDASIKSKIERIVWYNESIKPFEGFNYECNKSAADFVFKSDIRIDVIWNLQKEGAMIDTSFYSACKKSNNILSRVLLHVYGQPAVYEKLIQHHFSLCDDLVGVYITNPELFDVSNVLSTPKIRYNQDYDINGVKEAICDMICGRYVLGKNVVFNEFPKNREMFTYDVRQIMDSAISKYGLDEWKANVMTDEFHRHLGVFSIVGAKMGIKAREIFGITVDLLEVTSFAGTKPPYSCLNDGIQVSTGATLGMGTIHIANDSLYRPAAIFTYKNRSIEISLKPEYLKKVDDDINEGIIKFGLMDDGYWKLIRRNALKYWIEWDRNKIFDIKELKNK
jgi:inosine-uridine nucleoside N-ribohydrolase/formylmethanofuran dehydrogenase subunit E